MKKSPSAPNLQRLNPTQNSEDFFTRDTPSSSNASLNSKASSNDSLSSGGQFKLEKKNKINTLKANSSSGSSNELITQGQVKTKYEVNTPPTTPNDKNNGSPTNSLDNFLSSPFDKEQNV